MSRELKAYLSAVQSAARQHEADSDAIQTSVDEIARVRNLITSLPEKVRHKAMVPFGKHAFFEGELIHTNEFLVGLGCELRLEASAQQAGEVLGRRQARAEAALAQTRQQLAELRSRAEELAASLSNEEDEALMDIREDLEDSESLLASAQPLPAAAVVVAPTAAVACIGNMQLAVERGPGTGRAGASSGNSEEADGNDDDRIFARLAELERLEAEADSDGDESEEGVSSGPAGEDSGRRGNPDRAARSGAEGTSTSKAGAGIGAERGSGLALHDDGGAAGRSAGALGSNTMDPPSPQTQVAVTMPSAASAPKAKAKAATPLKKGFLLGGSGGRRAPTPASAAAAAAGADPGPAPGALGGGGAPSSTSSAPSGSADTAAARRSSITQGVSAPTAHGRRVSFADGALLGKTDEEGVAGRSRQELNATSGPQRQWVHGGVAGVRPALKQGSSNPDYVGQQPTRGKAGGLERGTAGHSGGGLRPAAAKVAALEEDGGDASMAMARAREEAFTGVVRERASEDAGEDGVGSAASEGAAGSRLVALAAADAARGEQTEPPKRVSKFKQHRLGIA